MTIAVDFDGVIHAYSKGWQDGTIYDKPLPDALLALAEGYGLTDEQRAGLDRPEAEQPKRGPGMGMPDVLVEQMVRVSLAAVPPALRGPNWKARP